MSGFQLIHAQKRIEELTARVEALERLTVKDDDDPSVNPEQVKEWARDTKEMLQAAMQNTEVLYPSPAYRVEEQTRGWCHVVDADGNPVNAKMMRKGAAQTYVDGLNARGPTLKAINPDNIGNARSP